jgi:hypothetical protein
MLFDNIFIFIYQFKVYSTDYSNPIGKIPSSLELKTIVSQTRPVHLKLVVGSPRSLIRLSYFCHVAVMVWLTQLKSHVTIRVWHGTKEPRITLRHKL